VQDLLLSHVVWELRQLGVTKVSTPHCGTKTCLAIYQSLQTHCSMSVRKQRLDIIANFVGQKKETLLCFTLIGEEHVDAFLDVPETHGDAYHFCSVARVERSGWRIPPSSGAMLATGEVCAGVTVVDQDGL